MEKQEWNEREEMNEAAENDFLELIETGTNVEGKKNNA